MEVGLGPGDFVLVCPAPPPKKKTGHSPPIFGLCLLWPNGRPSQLLLSSCCTAYPLKPCTWSVNGVQQVASMCTPSNTWFVGSTGVCRPEGISIDPAVFRHPTSGRRTRTVQSYSPGCAIVHPQLIYVVLEARTNLSWQTAPRSVQWGWLVSVRHRDKFREDQWNCCRDTAI